MAISRFVGGVRPGPARSLIRSLVGAVLLGAAAGPAAAADDRGKWTRARTDYVEVLTDAAPKDAAEFAVQYSAFRYALAELIGPRARRLPPTRVMLFRNQREFERRFPSEVARSESISVTTDVDGVTLLGQVLTGTRTFTLQLAFEFETLWALRRAGYAVPLWAGQGTGKVLATVALRKGVLTVGNFDRGDILSWVADPLPWPRFFDVHAGSKDYVGNDGRPRPFHAQSWALMHWIWLADGEGLARFEKLQEALRVKGGLDAMAAATGVPPNEWIKRIDAHLRNKQSVRTLPFDEAAVRARMETGPATPAAVSLHLSELLAGRGRDAGAELELLRAVAAEPEAAPVKEAQARRARRKGDRESAVRYYREAISAGSGNPVAFQVSASDRMDQTVVGVDRVGAGGIFVEEALAEIRRALELRPGDPDSYRLLGRAFYLRPEVGPVHAEELGAGVTAADESGLVRLYRASLYERLGDEAALAADLEELARNPRYGAAIRRQATQQLETRRFEATVAAANEQVAAGRFAETLALVRARQAAALDAESAERYGPLLRWVEEREKAAGPAKP